MSEDILGYSSHDWRKNTDSAIVIDDKNRTYAKVNDCKVSFKNPRTLQKEEVFGTVEAVKTVSDLFLPVSGEIIELNEALEDAPEQVNEDPYGAGWMVKVKCSDVSEIESLLDATAYKALIGG